MMKQRRAFVAVGLGALLLSTLLAIRVLSEVGWDPTHFVAFGREQDSTRDYAEERLGDVSLRAGLGHDGKFFFVQANDPWIVDPETNARVLDRPLYRSQRMFYPVLASGGGVLGPQAIVWGMLIVNLLATAAGTWATAGIASEMGGSPWWGLAFALNVGFISELNIGGAGVVAAAAAFTAVLLTMKGQLPWAIALLTIACLAREAMLIAAAGTALWLWLANRRRWALGAALVPGLAVLAWAAYLRIRIGDGLVTPEVQEIGWPLVGFVEAFESWSRNPINLAVGVTMLVMFVLFTRRVLLGRQLVGWAFLGFVVLGIVFTEQVWESYFDITRAVAPVITSFVLLVFLESTNQESVPGSERAVRTK
jgi:hypothetical protein